ncbi:PD40 domain-containing protein [Ichthyenterobacterium magnum]|uniref:WD40 repeat protein n=1 Tax=Ichthyenterobacterium magnum TaxID=1230530 RepID=A0A420DFF3_9FLAO|nr:PD40 domain-containing protein [Ichthyenterobacterium magnum]RKE91893.1 WD40 repeat protein [Ichthyenterobacterium magnum]
MKTAALSMFTTLLLFVVLSVSNNKTNSTNNSSTNTDQLNESGLKFYVHNSDVNTKYTELASTVFRNKLILVSSKKIGGLGSGIDKNTNEPFTELFCLDLNSYGTVSNPLLFSRIINTKGNEGQIAFSPDERTMYFTRSSRDNSKNYQLYKTVLEKDSNGKWINEQELYISSANYSIENPHITADGKQLYFSSNMPGSYGGYDLYVSDINEDGLLGEPKNLGEMINTSLDDKFPHLSKDGKKLFFSSKGHNTIGGFDVFVSNIVFNTYKSPRNLGTGVNSSDDEVAFLFINEDKGFFSSNKNNAQGSFDLYRFKANTIYQNIEGIIVNDVDQPISNATILLLDEEGNEIERQTTGIDAYYNFKIKAFENYSLKILKSGFENSEFVFSANQHEQKTYKEIHKLSETSSVITKK